ncbi:MAG TPA: heme-binding beta-barrel domain-containing protein, partial [Anaerolineae bacterium]
TLLAGTWTGSGRGYYPTIPSFEYTETLAITYDPARDLIHYEQRTDKRYADQATDGPSHWESGFMRATAPAMIELTNAQSGGRLEVLTGTITQADDYWIIDMESTQIVNDPRVLKTRRRMTVSGATLTYTMDMHTNRVDKLTAHLEARLHRSKQE